MEKGSARSRRIAALIAVVMIALFMSSPAVFGKKTIPREGLETRADIIRIDSMQVFGKLERPPVTFLHQKHTEALEKKDKDCSACHLSEKDKSTDQDRLSTKYKRLKDTAKQEVMDLYHDNCIGCHKETKAAKEKSGPLECGECHQDRVIVISSWKAIGMDKSLHYRHSKAMDKKCEKCHHEYDEGNQKLIYAKGQEGTCRYCHGQKKEENRISMRKASHIACINCHRQKIANNESAGPSNCQGCHEPSEQKMITVVDDVPRMQRSQPDYVFIKTAAADEKKADSLIRMNLVPFNHQAHEQYNDSCRVCHHADLNECAQCHTLQGSEKGNYVNLEQAMHRVGDNQSCIGCHESKLNNQSCAGCHTSFEKKRLQGTDSCLNCHLVSSDEVGGLVPGNEEKILAAGSLESREAITETYADEDIPDIVSIDALKDQYGPVKLPHRKIIRSMFNNIKDNKLANYFHHDPGTICQGCHHNSPAAKKPPKCASCHGRPFNEKDPFKPGLMAAYHRQCMECHKAMGIARPVATNCTACHQKRS